MFWGEVLNSADTGFAFAYEIRERYFNILVCILQRAGYMAQWRSQNHRDPIFVFTYVANRLNAKTVEEAPCTVKIGANTSLGYRVESTDSKKKHKPGNLL